MLFFISLFCAVENWCYSGNWTSIWKGNNKQITSLELSVVFVISKSNNDFNNLPEVINNNELIIAFCFHSSKCQSVCSFFFSYLPQLDLTLTYLLICMFPFAQKSHCTKFDGSILWTSSFQVLFLLGCPHAILKDPYMTSPPVTIMLQKINPCLMELCRFFQLCLCVGQRRHSIKDAMR